MRQGILLHRPHGALRRVSGGGGARDGPVVLVTRGVGDLQVRVGFGFEPCVRLRFPAIPTPFHPPPRPSFCVRGSYRHGDLCEECPSHAKCPEGTTLADLDIGKDYYRFADDSDKLYECKLPAGCRGWTKADHPGSNETSAGDTLCNLGYGGALCSIWCAGVASANRKPPWLKLDRVSSCHLPARSHTVALTTAPTLTPRLSLTASPLPASETGYFQDSVTETCSQCSTQSVVTSPMTMATMAAAVCVASASFTVYLLQPKWLQRFQETYPDRLAAVSRQGTVLFVTTQIISALQESHEFQGGSSYPYPYSEVARVAEFISLNVMEVGVEGWSCVERGLFFAPSFPPPPTSNAHLRWAARC